jgi:hypothetical protein
MCWFKRAWRGEERLWKVFWLYSVLGPIVAYLALIVVPLETKNIVIVSYSYFFALLAVFNSMLVVPLWRCAANTSWWLWTRLARIEVLLLIVQILVFVFSGGVSDLSGRERASEACRVILEDQAREKHVDISQYVSDHHQEEATCIQNISAVFR